MNDFRRGDIVAVLFPYADHKTVKQRPALVVQADSLRTEFSQLIVAQITSKTVRSGRPSRFYVLWRYAYKAAELDAGEAIVFTYGQPVELDGHRGLSSGNRALVEKKKGKYRLRDFTERGHDEKLGLPDAQVGTPAPLVDVLHRVLWLTENEPRNLTQFLDESRPDRERLRLVAQALAGAGLKGKSEDGAKALVSTTASEQAALGKLLANWRSLIEASVTPLFDSRSGV